jgi:hypothetical protein
VVLSLWKCKTWRSKLFELGDGCLPKKAKIAGYSLSHAFLQAMQRLVVFACLPPPTDIFLQLPVGLLQLHVLAQ